MAAPRIWPSTAVTVSASAISRITCLIPTPHRLTVYASAAPLPDAPATLVIGRLARPYPSGTFPRRIALTSPSARRLPQESAGVRQGALYPMRFDEGPVGFAPRQSSRLSRKPPAHRAPCASENAFARKVEPNARLHRAREDQIA